jgi:hypothetical protein
VEVVAERVRLMKAVMVVQESCLNQDEVEQAINEIALRLHKGFKPVLAQVSMEGQATSTPTISTLLGLVAFAASEVACGVQIMARYEADKDKLAKFCTESFRQWMLDEIEQNIVELPN